MKSALLVLAIVAAASLVQAQERDALPAAATQARVVRDAAIDRANQNYRRALDRELAIAEQRGDAKAVDALKSEIAEIGAAWPPKPAGADESRGWRVIFRSQDPIKWNKSVRGGEGEDVAVPIPAQGFSGYVRLRRMDTGDFVILQVDLANMATDERVDGRYAWIGSARHEYRVRPDKIVQENRLLGIADTWREVPYHGTPGLLMNKAGTPREGFTGWGFGKHALVYSGQSYVWNGEHIQPTAFEVAVKPGGSLTDDEKGRLLNRDFAEREQPLAARAGDAGGGAPAAAALVPFKYEYEWGLVGREGTGRMTIRGRDGARTRVRYTYEEWRTDAIAVSVYITQTSGRPCAVSFVAAVGGPDVGWSSRRPTRIGMGTYRTPVLQPGEVYEAKLEIRVPDPEDVKYVEVGNVVEITP